MMDFFPALLQQLPGPVNLFIGFFLVLLVFCSFLGFTYWISKDE